MVRRIVVGLAAASGTLAYLVLLVVGVSLAGVEQSGARGFGVLLAVAATLAFAATLFICFASAARFQGGARRAGAAIATILAIAPPSALAGAAFTFAGLPLDSAMPAVDWALFGLGIFFALGALAAAVVGWRRMSARPPPQPVRPSEPQAVTPA